MFKIFRVTIDYIENSLRPHRKYFAPSIISKIFRVTIDYIEHISRPHPLYRKYFESPLIISKIFSVPIHYIANVSRPHGEDVRGADAQKICHPR